MSRPPSPNIDDEAPNTMEAEYVETQAEGSNEQPEPKPRTRKPKAPETLAREPGKSLLPHARVQKILKADKELVMVQREAAFLISLATEQFVQRIAEAAHRVAERERRTTVQGKDLVACVRRADEFAFLEELLPWLEPESAAPGKRRPRAELNKETGKKTMLDQFVNKSAADDNGPAMELVTNDDGTMSLVPAETPT